MASVHMQNGQFSPARTAGCLNRKEAKTNTLPEYVVGSIRTLQLIMWALTKQNFCYRSTKQIAKKAHNKSSHSYWPPGVRRTKISCRHKTSKIETIFHHRRPMNKHISNTDTEEKRYLYTHEREMRRLIYEKYTHLCGAAAL